MELMEFLPIVLYVSAIALIIVLIILGVKLITTIDRANRILDDLERKTRSLNGLFNAIDSITDTLSVFSDTLVSSITGIFGKVFHKKSKKKKVKKEISGDEE
ncbi:MAG: hypothetical protein E7168_01860 [Firmicutes bacterium]|nr:hypothetical protein [Bacillota bacterium]